MLGEKVQEMQNELGKKNEFTGEGNEPLKGSKTNKKTSLTSSKAYSF